jgi:hypothetical protein
MIKKEIRWRQSRNRAFLTTILLLMVTLVVMIMIQDLFNLIFAFQLDEFDGRNVSWNRYEGWVADHTGSGRTILIFDQ